MFDDVFRLDKVFETGGQVKVWSEFEEKKWRVNAPEDATSGDGHDYCALKHLCRLLDFEETVDAL
jgi:hypothetical protein